MQVRRGKVTFSLGPLTSTVIDRARWRGRDEWPAWPPYADEAERLFSFAVSRGVFDMYLPELCGKQSQRDSAIAELRVAYFLDRSWFRVVEWRPKGEKGREGEFAVRCPSGGDIFVEVKSPGWESELSPPEIGAGRAKQDKYIDGEGRTLDNSAAVAYAVEKAYPKLKARTSNLLVVADDLFVSLEHGTDIWAYEALYHRARLAGQLLPGKFATPAFSRLGGVGLFWHKYERSCLWYEMRLFVNPFAETGCALPPAFAWAFGGTLL